MALAPADVKRTIAAHGQASKAQIQLGVQRLLRLPVGRRARPTWPTRWRSP